MLVKLHYFDELIDANEISLSNYARTLLYEIGIVREDNVPDTIKSLIGMAKKRLAVEEIVDAQKE
jgi:hypothetical protein